MRAITTFLAIAATLAVTTVIILACDLNNRLQSLEKLKKECISLDERLKELGAKDYGPQVNLKVRACREQGWWNDAEIQPAK